MEMLDATMMKQNPAKYQDRFNKLQKILLLRAALDPNFLKNPEEIGKVITNTTYADGDRNITDILMVCKCWTLNRRDPGFPINWTIACWEIRSPISEKLNKHELIFSLGYFLQSWQVAQHIVR
jgi:hypothetical protein